MVDVDTEFRRLRNELFVPIKLADAEGLVRAEYKEALEPFKELSWLTTSNPHVAEHAELYAGSRAIVDPWRSGMTLLPLVKNHHVYARHIRPEEFEAGLPPRFVNGVVAAELSVLTPDPLAYLRAAKNRSAIVVCSFTGPQNFFTAIKGGLRMYNPQIQVEAAEALLAKAQYEGALRDRFGWLPPLKDFSEVLGMDVEQVGKWLKKQKKLLGQASWLHTLCYLDEQFGDQIGASEKLEAYFSSLGPHKSALRKLEGVRKHKPEKLYQAAENLGRNLRQANDVGCLVLDVAPRDITIDDVFNAWFVDMEHIEFKDKLNKRDRKRQLRLVEKEFCEDYLIQEAKMQEYDLGKLVTIVHEAYEA